ncbi:MAG: UDP-N-acetylmuramoyl-tripeptide--D-alanyl-D-alanine ligase, partial [Ignavibacteriales bacterium]|nr:UDP-N-acetylmuramoyl-tripeptide--D-alanyl-D-alanine ligase [Ignavibacteriales bacterium]
MKLTIEEIFSIEHTRIVGAEAAKKANVSGVSTDSRSIASGNVFVAIRGEKFDGHNFISAAVQAGAGVIVLEQSWAEKNQAMLISLNRTIVIVVDTTKALGELARIHRRKFRIPVIAIGGSNGKTTTKDMLRAVLAKKFDVLATEGNLNNHIGVPQTLFKLEKKHSIAVVEIGTNHPGEIAHLCEVLEPTHGIITNIGREHLEYFGSLKGVAAAECELFSWLAKHKGTAFINADDGLLKQHTK